MKLKSISRSEKTGTLGNGKKVRFVEGCVGDEYCDNCDLAVYKHVFNRRCFTTSFGDKTITANKCCGLDRKDKKNGYWKLVKDKPNLT